MDRQSGKTTMLAKATMEDEDNIMIVPNSRYRAYVLNEHKLKPGQIFTITDVINRKLVGRKIKKIVIDEVGMCLEQMHPKIELGTHTDC